MTGSGSVRSRRYRRRRAAGRAVYRVEVDDGALVDLLVATRRLDLNSADNPDRVRTALEQLVASLVAMDLDIDRP